MSLKLMYITNIPEVAKIAEEAGVDRIFVDMEYIGKEKRQGGLDTVQCHHTFDDIKRISDVLECSELLVRVNPIHEATDEYVSSEEEIDIAIECGADILMLPYFKTVYEAKRFLKHVNRRVKTILLIETPEAVEAIDEILSIEEIDEVFIGLNDLSLGYGYKFMFQPLANGIVEKLCLKFKNKEIKYGFGGIASLGKGMLNSERILFEHYRLDSSSVILSRSFCNINTMHSLKEVEDTFASGVAAIRDYEQCIKQHDLNDSIYNENHIEVQKIVSEIVGS